jgi:hypothetical protein
MSEKKTAKFVLNDPSAGPFSIRVAPDSGEVDENGRPLKDGKVTITADEPFEAKDITRKVKVNQRQPDGTYQEVEIDRTIDVAARLRQHPARVSEMKDETAKRRDAAKAEVAKAEADARTSGRKGR